MLDIIILFDISARLTLQVTSIICHDIKKKIIKKNTKIWGLDQNPYMLTKTIHRYTILINKEL